MPEPSQATHLRGSVCPVESHVLQGGCHPAFPPQVGQAVTSPVPKHEAHSSYVDPAASLNSPSHPQAAFFVVSSGSCSALMSSSCASHVSRHILSPPVASGSTQP